MRIGLVSGYSAPGDYGREELVTPCASCATPIEQARKTLKLYSVIVIQADARLREGE